jgi:hypothetical protein
MERTATTLAGDKPEAKAATGKQNSPAPPATAPAPYSTPVWVPRPTLVLRVAADWN